MKSVLDQILNFRLIFVIYALCIVSIPLATISVLSGNLYDIRLWELLLIPVIFFKLKYFFQLPNSRLFFLLGIYFFSIICSLIDFNFINLYQTASQIFLNSFFLIFALTVSLFYKKNELIIINWIFILLSIYLGIHSFIDVFLNKPQFTKYFYDGFLYNNIKMEIIRSQGFFAEPNELSVFLNIPFAFLLSRFFLKIRIAFFEYWLLVFGLLFVLISQFFSFSRGGLISFLAEILALFFIANCYKVGRHKFIRLISILGFLTFLFFVAYIYIGNDLIDYLIVYLFRIENFFSSHDPTTSIRLNSIMLGINTILDEPIKLFFGIGFGAYRSILGDMSTSSNILVDSLVETGFFGFFIFLYLLFYGFFVIFRSLKYLVVKNDETMSIICFSILLSYIGLLVGGQTYAIHKINYFWLVYGLIFALRNFIKGKNDNN